MLRLRGDTGLSIDPKVVRDVSAALYPAKMSTMQHLA